MRNIYFTVSLIAIHCSFKAQNIGYFGKKTSIEVNVGVKPDFNKRLLYRSTKLSASVNYGFAIRRQTKSNKGIGFSMTSTKLQFNSDNTIMTIPITDGYFGSLATSEYSGIIDAGMRVNRYALFMEIGKKSSTLPIGFSNEIGVGYYSANISNFSFRPTSSYYYNNATPTKSTYGLSDLNPNNIKKTGVYFHWRINVKIPVSERFLINMSYLSNLSFPLNTYYDGYSQTYIRFSDYKAYIKNAAYMDIGTFKIGGVFVF
jgi:hypothetical protein